MKILKTICLIMTIITMTSCGGSTAKGDDKTDSKVLVAYFSATGTTKKVAEKIAADAGATLFEIEPTQRYTNADLDWQNDRSRSSVEMKDKTSRPEIKNKVEDMGKYDVIFVGFPIWWYTCPTIINTFLESYDLKDKTIIPFATSGGSPIAPCIADMEKSAPGANFRDARLLNSQTDEQIKQWVEQVLPKQ